jgi:hypothetical protein
VANTLAYDDMATLNALISFIVQAPEREWGLSAGYLYSIGILLMLLVPNPPLPPPQNFHSVKIRNALSLLPKSNIHEQIKDCCPVMGSTLVGSSLHCKYWTRVDVVHV